MLTDRVLKRALDPNLGLPREEELFVRDVFVPDAYVVDRTKRLVTKNGRLVGMFTLVDEARMYCQHLRALFPSTSSAEIA